METVMQAEQARQKHSHATSRLLPDLAALRAYQTDLEDLAANTIEANPFFEPWCLFPALAFLPDSAAAQFLMIEQDGQLIGFLPLCKDKGYSHLPVSYLRTFMHRHCFLGTPLLRKGFERAFFQAIADGLPGTNMRGKFLQLRHLVAEGPFSHALQEIYRPEQAYKPLTWQRAALQSSFSAEQYLHTHLRSKKRKEMRRLHNRLSEEGPVSCHQLQTMADAPQWCQRFMGMEHDGWRGHGGSSLLAEQTPPAYLENMICGALAMNKLVFLQLDVGKTPIAMLINFKDGPRGWSFKIAFNAAYSRFSPGVLIEQELIRLALDKKIFERIDSCASANHPMINKLWAEREAMCYWNITLPGTGNKFAFNLCRKLEYFSARTKQFLQPTEIEHDI